DKSVARDAKSRSHPLCNAVSDSARKSKEVAGNENRGSFSAALQRQRFYEQILQHAFRWLGAGCISGHPEGIRGGDLYRGYPGHPAGPVMRGVVSDKERYHAGNEGPSGKPERGSGLHLPTSSRAPSLCKRVSVHCTSARSV